MQSRLMSTYEWQVDACVDDFTHKYSSHMQLQQISLTISFIFRTDAESEVRRMQLIETRCIGARISVKRIPVRHITKQEHSQSADLRQDESGRDPGQNSGSGWLLTCNGELPCRKITFLIKFFRKVRSVFPEMWAKMWKMFQLAMLKNPLKNSYIRIQRRIVGKWRILWQLVCGLGCWGWLSCDSVRRNNRVPRVPRTDVSVTVWLSGAY